MKTNIATTKEQSDRLLKCGVPAESADMFYTNYPNKPNNNKLHIGGVGIRKDLIPAFSLCSLYSLLPKEIKVDESPYDEVQKYGLLIYPFMGGWQVDYQYCEDDECHCLKCVHGTDLIEACVKAIEWLAEDGYKLNGIEKGGEDGSD